MLHSAITLDSTMKTWDALLALSEYHDDTIVVIRRRKETTVCWYIRHVADFKKFSASTGLETLEKSFNLHEPMGDKTYQIRHIPRDQMDKLSGILLDGERFIGVLLEQTKSAVSFGIDLGTLEAYEYVPPSHSPHTTPVQISPYPRLEAPDNVNPSQEFDLIIGLSREHVDGTVGPRMMEFTVTEEEFDMTVQVFADGFSSPENEGFRRNLHVKRSNFEEAETKVKLIAPAISELLKTMLEVQYSYKGNVVGKAWREIYVVPTNTPVPTDKPKTGARAISNLEPDKTPDLTVTISKREKGQLLLWAFDSNLVKLPSFSEPPKSEFNQDSARTFAFTNIKSIAEAEGKFIDEKLRGVGRIIARKMPREFWEILDMVWTYVKETSPGQVPTLLFISEDPYIPWELAIIEKPFVKSTLIDSSRPPFLGAQLKVGRWLPAGVEMPEGSLFPQLPPDTNIDITTLALVIGDYKGKQALPEAIEEGKDLKRVCPAVWLDATLDDVNNLMADSLSIEGEEVSVQAVHFACHGAVFPADARYSGIMLSDTGLRLSEDMIMGTEMPPKQQPFVFLNACEVGLASEILGAYGGFAAAFVNEGARGFIAPLWKVNDKIAHEIAIKFYTRTLTDGVDVSEVMREVRKGFDMTQEVPASTYLAYVFYGHPNLVLRKV